MPSARDGWCVAKVIATLTGYTRPTLSWKVPTNAEKNLLPSRSTTSRFRSNSAPPLDSPRLSNRTGIGFWNHWHRSRIRTRAKSLCATIRLKPRRLGEFALLLCTFLLLVPCRLSRKWVCSSSLHARGVAVLMNGVGRHGAADECSQSHAC